MPPAVADSLGVAARSPLGKEASAPSLHANVTWTFTGNLVSAACQWAMVVAIAKMGNTAMVGQYALALAIVAPLILFSNLQLRSIQATDVGSEFEFGDYLGLRLLTTGMAGSAVLLLVIAGAYQAATALTIVGLTLSKSLEGVSDTLYGFLQKQERMDRIAQSIMLRMPLSLVVLIAALHWTHSVFVGTLGFAGVQALVLASYDLPVSMRLARTMRAAGVAAIPVNFSPHWRWPALRTLAWTALPLGGAMLLISLQTNIPRYFIEHFGGVSEVGVFAALAYFLAAGNIVTEAVGQSVTPRLARMYQQQEQPRLRRLLWQLSALGALGGGLALMGGWLVGPQILSLLYRPEYAKHMDVFLILLLSAAPTYIASFFGYAMTAARLFWLQLPLSLLSTASVALACLWLVPTRGLVGAAEAILVLSFVRLFATFLVLAKVS